MANYNFKFTHIKGTSNSIADCMSRLTRCIREVPHYPLADPTLVTRAKTVKGSQEQIQRGDPWIQRLAEAGMKDMESLSMIHSIEAGTTPTDLPKDNKLRKWKGFGVSYKILLFMMVKPSY